MELSNILKDVRNRTEFRAWLDTHCQTETECYLRLKRGRPIEDGETFWLDRLNYPKHRWSDMAALRSPQTQKPVDRAQQGTRPPSRETRPHDGGGAPRPSSHGSAKLPRRPGHRVSAQRCPLLVEVQTFSRALPAHPSLQHHLS